MYGLWDTADMEERTLFNCNFFFFSEIEITIFNFRAHIAKIDGMCIRQRIFAIIFVLKLCRVVIDSPQSNIFKDK